MLGVVLYILYVYPVGVHNNVLGMCGSISFDVWDMIAHETTSGSHQNEPLFARPLTKRVRKERI